MSLCHLNDLTKYQVFNSDKFTLEQLINFNLFYFIVFQNLISFQVTCMIGSLFQNTVNVVNIKLPITKKENESVSEVTLDNFFLYKGVNSIKLYKCNVQSWVRFQTLKRQQHL